MGMACPQRAAGPQQRILTRPSRNTQQGCAYIPDQIRSSQDSANKLYVSLDLSSMGRYLMMAVRIPATTSPQPLGVLPVGSEIETVQGTIEHTQTECKATRSWFLLDRCKIKEASLELLGRFTTVLGALFAVSDMPRKHCAVDHESLSLIHI